MGGLPDRRCGSYDCEYVEGQRREDIPAEGLYAHEAERETDCRGATGCSKGHNRWLQVKNNGIW